MVLVCVTTFKGHHKMQDRWENREYVVKKQPYPNIPVYVVCPRDGEGCSQTLHRNYLLPSALTWSRKKQMELKKESKITPLQLQCYLQTITHKTVQINLFLLDTALEPPGTNFPGGIKTLVCQLALGQLASWMHGLTCLSA